MLYLKTFGNEKWLYDSGLKNYFETHKAAELIFDVTRIEYVLSKNERTDEENMDSLVKMILVLANLLTDNTGIFNDDSK